MKKSLSHLPYNKQDELKTIVKHVLELLGSSCEMIILYGSYARGTYVDYDQRTEYGVQTFFMSDYDLLVVTNKEKRTSTHTFDRLLEKAEERFYKGRDYSTVTPIQFIHEDIHELNKALSKGRYFYTDIKKYGIMLYNSGNYRLVRRKKFNYREIKELAEEYFKEKFQTAVYFLDDAIANYSKERYKMSSFYLHQACENCYFAIELTHTFYSAKEHNLTKLAGSAKRHSLEPSKAFPRDTKEEKRLFTLLENAYVQARYNSKFVVTKEDIEALILKVKLLCDIARQVCEKRIKEYERLAGKQ